MKNYFLLCFVFIQTFLFSQNTELGVLVGGSLYTGDLGVSPSNFLPQTHPAVGLMGRQHLSEKFAVRALFAIGGISGDEKKYPTRGHLEERGFNFKATVAELGIIPEWRPFSVGNVHFYLFGGLSAVYVNPKSYFNDQATSASNAAIAEDQSQKYPKIALAIPAGGGFQWNMNETTALGLELGFRKTFTDYLDGFSATANSKSTDYYLITGLTLSKFFSMGNDKSGTKRTSYRRKGVNCPTFN